MTIKEQLEVSASEIGVSCDSCDFYIANNPKKNTPIENLCTNPENYQSSLHGNCYMSVTPVFFCANYDEFKGD